MSVINGHDDRANNTPDPDRSAGASTAAASAGKTAEAGSSTTGGTTTTTAPTSTSTTTGSTPGSERRGAPVTIEVAWIAEALSVLSKVLVDQNPQSRRAVIATQLGRALAGVLHEEPNAPRTRKVQVPADLASRIAVELFDAMADADRSGANNFDRWAFEVGIEFANAAGSAYTAPRI